MNNSKQIATKQPEQMDVFFNQRASNYDTHMKESVIAFDQFYQAIAEPIVSTEEPISILDLGCGTGLEFEGIFAKAPNAKIYGIACSAEMLAELQRKYHDRSPQLSLTQGSYLTIPFDKHTYQYIISVMTMHHLAYPHKLELYDKIRHALTPGGKYIEGDYLVSAEQEQQFLAKDRDVIGSLEQHQHGDLHIDIPFSRDTQQRILIEAGFSDVHLFWHQGDAAIFTATR